MRIGKATDTIAVCTFNAQAISANCISQYAVFDRHYFENCDKWYRTWRAEHPELTRIVFHGLRHSSATYQLMISGGDVKTVQKPCKWRIKEKSHEESYDSSRDFGALEGTRIPGPLIKRIQGASFVKFQKFEEALFLSYHRKTRLCTHRIICIQCNALQPLSSYSGVQKVCKNVQTGKTKPNGQINHRFYGRV